MKSAILVAVLATGCSAYEHVSFAVSEAGLAADWHSTLDASHDNWHKGGMAEQNPVLGPHPSQAAISAYFLGFVCLEVAEHYALPHWLSATLFTLQAAASANAVYGNIHEGTSW